MPATTLTSSSEPIPEPLRGSLLGLPSTHDLNNPVMKHPAFMGGFGMALVFGGGLVVLPSLVFLVVAAAGPLLVGMAGLGLIALALKKTPKCRRIDRYRPARRAAKNTIKPFLRSAS